MGNPIAVRPCCNVMAVKIGPAPFNRPRTNGRIRVTAARAWRGRLLHHCGRSQPLMGPAVHAPNRTPGEIDELRRGKKPMSISSMHKYR